VAACRQRARRTDIPPNFAHSGGWWRLGFKVAGSNDMNPYAFSRFPSLLVRRPGAVPEDLLSPELASFFQ
jgi:hypothetical protein